MLFAISILKKYILKKIDDLEKDNNVPYDAYDEVELSIHSEMEGEIRAYKDVLDFLTRR